MVQQLKIALLDVKTFVELASFVKDAEEGVTFWGHRYVYLKEYEDTLPIDSLALRVMSLVKNTDFDQKPEEKEALETIIIPQINDIYKNNDERYMNRFTQILRFIRDKWNFYKFVGYDTRFYWRAGYEQGFNYSEYNLRIFPIDLASQLIKADIHDVMEDCSTFSDLLPVLEEAQEDISFFGCRFVSFVDYDGTLFIHKLVAKVIEIAKSSLNYTGDDDYKNIVPLMEALYVQSEEKRLDKNMFTRVLCTIRDIWNQYFGESFEQSRAEWEQFKSDGIQVAE